MDKSHLIKHSQKWDYTGIFVSSLCLIHCISIPLLIALVPTLSLWLNNIFFEVGILLMAITVGLVSFVSSYLKHKKKHPLILGSIGLLFLLANVVLTLIIQFGSPQNPLEAGHSIHFPIFMILGGIFLIFGHVGNLHACHCFCDHSCADHQHKHS